MELEKVTAILPLQGFLCLILFFMFVRIWQTELNLKQECIPVECISSAAVAAGGVSAGGCLPGGVCPWGVCLPGGFIRGVSAQGGLSAWGVSAQGVSAKGCLPGGCLLGVSDPVHAGISPWTEWQTLVKILPCLNYVAEGKKFMKCWNVFTFISSTGTDQQQDATHCPCHTSLFKIKKVFSSYNILSKKAATFVFCVSPALESLPIRA